ncbi:MAG: DUF4268 domain-containing protein [Anaerolineales bacterium]|jgi:hypothetical protein
MNIGRLERVSLREVWPHEAKDFTVWLQDNIDVLSDAIGLELANAEAERSAGDFTVDLLAEDSSGAPVIIENQLERSDHDHLGKVITYLAALGCNTAIWIVSDPRSEHIGAVSWLNESSSGFFYLVKVEAVRIGESPPAPLLTLILGPSEEVRGVGDSKREFSERHRLRLQFWTELLQRAREKTRLHANISPGRDSWIGMGAGIAGLGLNYVILQHEGRVELYIDRGSGAGEENKSVFDHLYAKHEEIETAFGGDLNWQRLDEKRASRISETVETGGYRDENWQETQDAMIDAMIRFENALRPHIKKVQI